MLKKVLVMDDDPELCSMVETILRSIEITVYQAYSGREGLKKFYEIHPDLIILDIIMPGMSGFDVCARLREVSTVPILMLTARINENDMLRGFNMGVDDFMRKPFSKNELEARVLALLRRSGLHNSRDAGYMTSYEDSVLSIDLVSKTVRLRGTIVELSSREYSVLACLVRWQGKIVSQRELAREVWGESSSEGNSLSSLYVFYLRKKLQDGRYGHKYIRTLWGRGYCFEPLKAD